LSTSIPRIPKPERDIGGLQGTSATAVLRASGAQRATGGQMHQDVAVEAVQIATRPIPARLARGRIQLGRSSSRPRRAADEQHDPADNRYVRIIFT